MVSMEMVIERGQARCPFCVAVADYRFIERDRNLVRYEVHCHRCGERYREKLGAAAVSAALATVEPWLPVVPEPSVPLADRLRAGVAAARERSLAAAGRASTAVGTALQRRRTTPWLTGVLARAQRP